MNSNYYDCIVIGGGAAGGERPAAAVTPAVRYSIL